MFSCPYCTTIVKHRASIRRHLSKSHREKRVEWDNSDFIGKLVSHKSTTPTTTVATVSTTTQSCSVPIIIDSIVLSQPTSTTTEIPNENSIILQAPTPQEEPVKMETDDEIKNEEEYSDSTDSMLPKLYSNETSNNMNFNEQLEFQNIIYLKNELNDNSNAVNLDLVDKITEYSNMDSATAKISQFSNLTTVTSTSQELKEQRMLYQSQLQQSTLHTTNTDNLPKFTRVVDRSNDFDMMDLQSLISPDSGMIEFSNDLSDRSDSTVNNYSNNMSLQLQNGKCFQY